MAFRESGSMRPPLNPNRMQVCMQPIVIYTQPLVICMQSLVRMLSASSMAWRC